MVGLNFLWTSINEHLLVSFRALFFKENFMCLFLHRTCPLCPIHAICVEMYV